MNQDEKEIKRKLRVIRHAQQSGNVSKTCRYFGVGRASFYRRLTSCLNSNVVLLPIYILF